MEVSYQYARELQHELASSYLSCSVSLRPHQYVGHYKSTVCVSTSQLFDGCRVTLVAGRCLSVYNMGGTNL